MNKRQRKKAKKKFSESIKKDLSGILDLLKRMNTRAFLLSTWDEETPFEYFPLRLPSTEPINQEKLESFRELHKQAIS